jgi:hypothetical protein
MDDGFGMTYQRFVNIQLHMKKWPMASASIRIVQVHILKCIYLAT